MDLAFLNFALLTFSAIFVIVDPPGVVPLFVALTANDSEEKKRRMARRACLVAWSVLTVFALAGTWILELFGITLYGFKVAGGLLMLVTAYDQLRAERPRTRSTAHEPPLTAGKRMRVATPRTQEKTSRSRRLPPTCTPSTPPLAPTFTSSDMVPLSSGLAFRRRS